MIQLSVWLSSLIRLASIWGTAMAARPACGGWVVIATMNRIVSPSRLAVVMATQTGRDFRPSVSPASY
ncbi:hypothetical protein [Pseudogemmobacter sonorensis]|uniref:hypothetical protein n=1 Tax=Pseudogemmobacter sonorensis TaxID=2989681 RepID=UPI0036CE0E7A